MHFRIKKIFLSIDFFTTETRTDYENCSTDVIVVIEEEENTGEKVLKKYVASFFTYLNIKSLNSIHGNSGEFLKGKYFFSKNMILINDCHPANIKTVVEDMVDEGNFREIFRSI